MPRFTEFVLGKHRSAFGYKPDPRRYKVWNAPFIVDNRLKITADKLASDRPCTDSLKVMLDCYKMHDFNYKGLCDTQIHAFETCMADYKVKYVLSWSLYDTSTSCDWYSNHLVSWYHTITITQYKQRTMGEWVLYRDGKVCFFNQPVFLFKKKMAQSDDSFKSRPNTRKINKLLKTVPQPPMTLKIKHGEKKR